MNGTFQKQNYSAATIALLFLLLCASDASACPGCNYERMLMSNWHLKIWMIKVLMPLVFSFNRLDVVRVLYVFLGRV